MSGKNGSVTIKDVAKAARVSIATVSRVINNNLYAVNAKTRERVLAVVAELGFIPNAMARGIHTDKTGIVALLIPDIANPCYPDLTLAAESAAQKAGYSVVIANAQRSKVRLRQYLDTFRERRLEGVILVGGGLSRDALGQNPFAAGRMRTVVVGKTVAPGGVAVRVDNVAAGRLAAEYLIGRGHRDIAMMAGPAGFDSAGDREIGYFEALADHGIVARKKWVVRGGFTYEGGYAAVDKLPLDEDRRITALFAQNDLMAAGAVNALRRRGVRVPEDMSVIGVDDIPQAAQFHPALTTVKVDYGEIGRRSMEQLIRLLDGRKAERTTLIPVSVLERETVADCGGGGTAEL